VRDRASKIRFTSAILPPYLRRTKTIEELLPWLYLKGISTGDFSEAPASLLGRDAPGLARGHYYMLFTDTTALVANSNKAQIWSLSI
jgi:hypothetical protein